MTIRDLGYRPYEGARLPPAHAAVVLFRHGLGRTWSSWLVKIACLTCWGPALVASAAYAIFTTFVAASPDMPPPEPAALVRVVMTWQLWAFATVTTLGAGAGMIAEDLTHRAFQFYFSKPVTAVQYLLGRVGAVSVFSCFVVLAPTALFVAMLAGTAPEGERLTRLALLIPTLAGSLVVSVVMSALSVAISALSPSRALTISAWGLLFLVPHVLALVVTAVGDAPWALLVSIPALLGAVLDGLYRVPVEGVVRWYHAAPLLTAGSALALWYAHRRVSRVEVIA